MAAYFLHQEFLWSYFIIIEKSNFFALIFTGFHIVSFHLYNIHLINPKGSFNIDNFFFQLSPSQIFCWSHVVGKSESGQPSLYRRDSSVISALDFPAMEPWEARECKTAICLAWHKYNLSLDSLKFGKLPF